MVSRVGRVSTSDPPAALALWHRDYNNGGRVVAHAGDPAGQREGFCSVLVLPLNKSPLNHK